MTLLMKILVGVTTLCTLKILNMYNEVWGNLCSPREILVWVKNKYIKLSVLEYDMNKSCTCYTFEYNIVLCAVIRVHEQ